MNTGRGLIINVNDNSSHYLVNIDFTYFIMYAHVCLFCTVYSHITKVKGCVEWCFRRKKKCSLFPLTPPKKLGRVGWRNFFFLLTFFSFFFQRKLLIFILQTCSFLLFLL